MVGGPLKITSLLALASPGQGSTGQGFLSMLFQDELQVPRAQRLLGPGTASRAMVSNGRQSSQELGRERTGRNQSP